MTWLKGMFTAPRASDATIAAARATSRLIRTAIRLGFTISWRSRSVAEVLPAQETDRLADICSGLKQTVIG